MSFADTIGKSLQGIDFKGALIPGLVGAAVFASPGIAAAIAGAVTGVVGIGGVAGGLFAASHDQRVRTAASDLGNFISSNFFSSGSSFVDPIVASVDILKKDFADLDLSHTFALAAPYVTELAAGLGGLATSFMPGFNKALHDAAPTIQVLANDLPKIGKALGDMTAKLADSKGATEGLDSLLADTVGLIDVLGTSLAWLGDRYADYNSFVEGSFKGIAKLENLLGDKASAKDAQDVADAYGAVGRQAYHAAGGLVALDTANVNSLIGYRESEKAARALDAAMKDINDELDKWINKSLGASNATIAVAQDFADLGKTGVKGWNLNTQAGRDNQKMINQSIADLERQRQAAIDAGDGSKASVDAANKSYEDQLDHLKKIAAGLGATKAQVDALAGDYNVNVFYHGISEGLAAGAVGKEIKYTIGKRASGGPVMAGQPYVVGEHRPELFVPSQNGYIMPTVPTASSGGGGTVRHVIDLMVNGRLLRTISIDDAVARGVSSTAINVAYP